MSALFLNVTGAGHKGVISPRVQYWCSPESHPSELFLLVNIQNKNF